MHDHQYRRHNRDKDTVKHVKSEQRRGADDRSGGQERSGIVPRRDQAGQVAHLFRQGAFIAEQRRRAGHIGADRDRPDRELIPRQEIAGKRKEKGQDQEQDPDDPVEFARRFVRPCHKDPEHMQHYQDDHSVRCPAMHIPHDHPEGDVELEIFHVDEGILGNGAIIKHQDHAGDRQDEKKEKGQTAGAPGIGNLDPVTPDFGRMQMEKDVRRGHQDPVSRRILITVPEDRLPDVRLDDQLANLFVFGLQLN